MKRQWTDEKNNIWEVSDGKRGCSVALYEAAGPRVEVPTECQGQRVIEIERKAFLSKKEIKEITLPETIESIGDWAFSHAMALTKIVVRSKETSFGRKLFLGCKNLEKIYVGNDDDIQAQMTAIGVRYFEEDTILSDPDRGSLEWYKRWDEALLKFVDKDDLDGFMELWTCGEEDYEGKDYDISSYPVERRYEKLRIIYFRLINDRMLSEENRSRLQSYISSHTKGQQIEDAWNIVVEEYGDDLEVYKQLIEAGGLNLDNFNAVFEDVQEKNPQVKAYLLKWKKDNVGTQVKNNQKDEFDLGW